MSERMRQFLKNALFMAAAALVMRTVGVSYHAYLSARVGAEGMGLFALVMSMQGFAVTFATSGVQLAVTRLVSESLGRGEYASARAALHRATVYAVCFSGAACLILFFGAPFFASYVLGDGRTVLSLRLLALALPPFALCAVMNGYFTAVGRVIGASAIQVAEGGVRILVTVCLISWLAPRGLTYTCAAVVAGAAIAQTLSCLFLSVRYWRDRRRIAGAGGGDEGMNRRLLRIALPVALSSYIRSGLLTVEHILIPRSLTRGGRRSREAALRDYGVLDGMALPVVMYPMALLSSFSSLLVPAFAESQARGEGRRIDRIASRALHLTTVFAMGCTACLAVFSRDLGIALYGSETAGHYIRLLAPVVPLMFLDHVTDCALKGLGEQVWSMWVNIADSCLSILLVCLLLPTQGAVGYIYVIVIAEAFNFTLSIARLCHVAKIRYSPLRSIVIPGVAALLAAFAVRRLFGIDPYTVTVVWLVAEMIFAAAVFLGVLALLTILSRLRAGKHISSLDIL
jgi:stage V sporulation protein B